MEAALENTPCGSRSPARGDPVFIGGCGGTRRGDVRRKAVVFPPPPSHRADVRHGGVVPLFPANYLLFDPFVFFFYYNLSAIITDQNQLLCSETRVSSNGHRVENCFLSFFLTPNTKAGSGGHS